MFVILANCSVMAVEPNCDDKSPIYNVLEFLFQFIYTIECVLKIIALGFVYENNSYLRDAWNVLDFMIVSSSWVTIWQGESSISAFRAIRALRTLRTLSSFPEMAKLVQMLIGIVPSMANIFLLCLITVLVFAIVSMQLFSGRLGHRCVMIDSIQKVPVWENEIRLSKSNFNQGILMNQTYNSDDEYICQISRQLRNAYNISAHIVKDPNDTCCPNPNYVCLWRGNPDNDNVNFDNLFSAGLIIFSMFTMDGWSDIMYMMRDVMESNFYDSFFLAVVYIGGFFIINLVSAIQFQYYDTLKQKRERETQKSKLMEFYGYPCQQKTVEKNLIQNCLETLANKEKGLLCECVRERFKCLVEDQRFEFFIQLVIIVNSVQLGSEFYDQPPEWTKFLYYSNIAFTVIFTIECATKIVGLTFFGYCQSAFNIFDMVVVVAGLIEVLNDGKSGGLSVLRSFRIMRILKLIKGAKGLQTLVRQIFAAMYESYNLGILIMLFVIINALIGKQLFREEILDGDGNKSRFEFSNFPCALQTVFICMTGFWVEPMQDTVRAHGTSAIFFFVEVTLIGYFILLNLFLAILLQNIDKVQEEEHKHSLTQGQQLKLAVKPLLSQSSELSGVANYLTSQSYAHSIESINQPEDSAETNIGKSNPQHSMDHAQQSILKKKVPLQKDSLEQVIVQPMKTPMGSVDSLQRVIHKVLKSSGKNDEYVPSFHSSDSWDSSPSYTDSYMDRSVTSPSVRDEEELPRMSSESFLEEAKQQSPLKILNVNRRHSQLMNKIPECLNESESDFSSRDSDYSSCAVQTIDKDVFFEKMKTIKMICSCEKEPDKKLMSTIPSFMIAVIEKDIKNRLHKKINELITDNQVPIGYEYEWIQTKYPEKMRAYLETEATHKMKQKATQKEKQRSVLKMEAILVNMQKKIIDKFLCVHKDGTKHRHKNAQHFIIQKGNTLLCFNDKGKCRKVAIALVQNEYFEALSLYLIIVYSGILMIMFDTQFDDQYTRNTVEYLEGVISAYFVLEVLVRIIAMGLICNPNSYLRHFINCVDFFLVLTIILSITLSLLDNKSGKKSDEMKQMLDTVGITKVLRALRPLRLAQAPALRNTIESLLTSIPDLTWALCLDVLFMYIFSILGMQMLQGRDSVCSDTGLETKDACLKGGQNWITPPANFDNIFNSMLTFFEIQSTEDWHEVLFRAIDSTNEVDHGPIKDSRGYLAIMFVVFISCTTFFILNFLITILITSYQYQSTKRFHLDELQHRQKLWITMQSFLIEASITTKTRRPPNTFCGCFYDIAIHPVFDNLISLCVAINTLGLCMEYENCPQWHQTMLEVSNTVFVAIFAVEAIIKILGFGCMQYFNSNQNLFDFFLVIVSLLGMFKSLINLNLTLLRVIRGARILRVFKSLRSLGELLNTLYQSSKSFVYVIFVSFIGLFVYALMGLKFYGDITIGCYGGLDEHANFTNMYNAVVTLMKAETGEGWNSMMHDTMAKNGKSASFFWVTFVILKVYILLNVVVALIFDKLQERAYQIAADHDTGTLIDAIKDFVSLWEDYDPTASAYIRTEQLEEFIKQLPPPLGFGADKDSKDDQIFGMIQGNMHQSHRESFAKKFMRTLNIPDHNGKVYFPEVLWASMYQVCGVSGSTIDNHLLMKEQFRRIQLKYRHLRTHQAYSWSKLTGTHRYDWLQDGLTAFQYMALVRAQRMWLKRRDGLVSLELQSKQQI